MESRADGANEGRCAFALLRCAYSSDCLRTSAYGVEILLIVKAFLLDGVACEASFPLYTLIKC